MALNVLHIGKYFPPRFGGVETFMSQLMKAQRKAGLEVSAIVHQEARDYQHEEERWQGCQVVYVKSYGQLVYAPVAPAFPVVLYRTLVRQRPDIIHVHMPNLSAFWLLLLQPFLPEAKWVIHWHSDVIGAVPDVRVKLLYPFYRLFERWLLTKAHKIICTSPNYLDSSRPLMPYQKKAVVIPLGIELPSTPPQQAQAQAITLPAQRCAENLPASPQPQLALRLICIGRLTYYKGHAYLIEALGKLQAQGVKVHLDVVGKGELEAPLRQLVATKGLNAFIHFHGEVTEQDKLNLLKNADLLCLPSIERTEAFGVVLLEAAACAKPALVTDVKGSGMTFVVEDGKTGLVVKPACAKSLMQAIRFACQQPQALIAMGQAANRKLRKQFAMPPIARQITGLYQHITR